MTQVVAVASIERAWTDLRAARPEITGCRVYRGAAARAVPVAGEGPALQVNAPAATSVELHRGFVGRLRQLGLAPREVELLEVTGLAIGFAPSAPVAMAVQVHAGLVVRFSDEADAAEAWTELDAWAGAYGQRILDRTLHLGAAPDVRPEVAAVREHHLLDRRGDRLVYLSGEPPPPGRPATWVAAPPDRFEFHHYLQRPLAA